MVSLYNKGIIEIEDFEKVVQLKIVFLEKTVDEITNQKERLSAKAVIEACNMILSGFRLIL